MTRIKYILAFLTAACFTVIPLTANAEFDWGAKYAGDFISGQSNARLLAMGGVGVAIAEGPSAILANPALIFADRANSVSLMHADRFESLVKVDHASYVLNSFDGRAMGLGMIRQGVDNIPVTQLENPSLPIRHDNRVRILEQTSASEYAFQFAYALDKPYGRIGASAKLLYKRLYDQDGLGLGIDVGYARRFGGLTLGAQLRDALTTVIVWETGRQEGIIPTADVGAAYLIEAPRLKADILFVSEARFRTEAIDDPDFASYHGGIEYCIQKVASARVGVDDRRLTYGAGLNLGPAALDYAFIGHSELGATHRISLGYRWGKTDI
ncbi:MAG: hypothetical protein P9L92_12585 [Candidatus Electryonea clarkiae]|nr:hypothetical protein [Candidatus Electryonea clarkiae]MDP8285049.1 hypothetical protein [Candidatus Electryonea clarkiae]